MATAKAKRSKKTPAAKKRPAKANAKSTTAIKPKDLHLPLPSAFQLVGQTWRIFKSNWRLLIGIVVVYLILNIIFASGLSSLNSAVHDIKNNLSSATSPHGLAKGLSGFSLLVSTAGASGSAAASLLQSGLFVVESLVIIWALRQVVAGNEISVKESYYRSTYPLIPFLLVLLVIFIQLLPISLGAVIVNAVLTTAAANLTWLTWFAWLVFIGLAAWSFYWVSASLFAVYIVTLPEVEPREALRAAHQLVNFRRRLVIPKIVFLPIFVLVVMGIIIIPLIIVSSALVAPVFYVLGMFAILFVHAYLYSLYRSLLG